ncbi:MAG: phosphoribosylglycinamide formyltransferase [Bacteroidota bacterium]
MMLRLAIFASGNGSNAQRIIEYFEGHPAVTIGMVLCNNPDAFVLTRAKTLGVPAVVFSRSDFYETSRIPELLEENTIDFLVLAGFLWLVPQNILQAFRGKIINIHPALLPKFGGKGMYGMKVHEAVIAARETESGITIHFVDEHYDEGRIIFQARCPVASAETPESLAGKIHQLEYRYFPEVIEKTVTHDT